MVQRTRILLALPILTAATLSAFPGDNSNSPFGGSSARDARQQQQQQQQQPAYLYAPEDQLYPYDDPADLPKQPDVMDPVIPSESNGSPQNTEPYYQEGEPPQPQKFETSRVYRPQFDPTLNALEEVQAVCDRLEKSLAHGEALRQRVRKNVDKIQGTSAVVLADAASLDQLAQETKGWKGLFHRYEKEAVDAADAAGEASIRVCNAMEEFGKGSALHASKLLLQMQGFNDVVVTEKDQFDKAFTEVSSLYEQVVGLEAAAEQVRIAHEKHAALLEEYEEQLKEIETAAFEVESELEAMQEQGDFLVNRHSEIQVSMNRRAIQIAPTMEGAVEELDRYERQLNEAFDAVEHAAERHEERAIQFLEDAVVLREDFDAVAGAPAAMWKEVASHYGSYTVVKALSKEILPLKDDLQELKANVDADAAASASCVVAAEAPEVKESKGAPGAANGQ